MRDFTRKPQGYGTQKSYREAETHPIKILIKAYQRVILQLKKVEEYFGELKYQKGEPHLLKAQLILHELRHSLTNEYNGNKELEELTNSLDETYFYILCELEFVSNTKNIKKLPQIIRIITENLLEPFQIVMDSEERKKQQLEGTTEHDNGI